MDLLNFLLPYLMGVLVSYLIFQPMKQWEDGYNTAKKFCGNWELGFDKGFEAAKKTFNNYDLGFGDGFEDGWNAVLEQYQRSEGEG
jgi:hypothetical protein